MEEFIIFNEAYKKYIEFLGVYFTFKKTKLGGMAPTFTPQAMNSILEVKFKLEPLAINVIYRLHQHFESEEQKKFMLKTVRKFVLHEIQTWKKIKYEGDYEMLKPGALFFLAKELGSFKKPRIPAAEKPDMDQSSSFIHPEALVNPLFHNSLSDYESKLSDNISVWKTGKDKIGCGSFCLFLFDKKYFVPNNLKTVKQFASAKYGIEINAMIDRLRKTTNKELLKNHREKIIRIILDKPFGTLPGF